MNPARRRRIAIVLGLAVAALVAAGVWSVARPRSTADRLGQWLDDEEGCSAVVRSGFEPDPRLEPGAAAPALSRAAVKLVLVQCRGITNAHGDATLWTFRSAAALRGALSAAGHGDVPVCALAHEAFTSSEPADAQRTFCRALGGHALGLAGGD